MKAENTTLNDIRTMVDRIDLILKAKNITARQFAEEIGIQPSGMSHIMSGRNNPSLDFVMKVMRRWPEININWLMFGKGEMFADPSSLQPQRPVAVPRQQPAVEPDLFTQPEAVVLPPQPEPQPDADPQPVPEVAAPDTTPQSEALSPVPDRHTAPEAEPSPQPAENRLYAPASAVSPVQPNPADKRVVKIIVLYADRTFAEYRPE